MATTLSMDQVPPKRRVCERVGQHFSYERPPVTAFAIDHTQPSSTEMGGGIYVCAECAPTLDPFIVTRVEALP